MVTTELAVFFALLLAIACLSVRPTPPMIHAHVASCEPRRTLQGDPLYLVTLEFDLDGAHVTQSVLMDFAHYARVQDLADVCLYRTVYGYEVRACPE